MIAPAKDDRRFRHEQWSENAVFDFVKQSYLLSAAACTARARCGRAGRHGSAQGRVPYAPAASTRSRPAISSTPTPRCWPRRWRAAAATWSRGWRTCSTISSAASGELKVSMTDRTAFELGRNIATTPGKVVFQNELIQLIQYEPTTKQVDRRPLLMHPALDQQVLYSRPPAEEQLHQVLRRSGQDRLRRSPGSIRTSATATSPGTPT